MGYIQKESSDFLRRISTFLDILKNILYSLNGILEIEIVSFKIAFCTDFFTKLNRFLDFITKIREHVSIFFLDCEDRGVIISC